MKNRFYILLMCCLLGLAGALSIVPAMASEWTGFAVPVVQGNTVTLKLEIVDRKTSEVLPYVSVSLTLEGEKTPSLFGLTDSTGEVIFKKVPKGRYRLEIQLMGYRSLERPVELESPLDLGRIELEEDRKVLDAASVSAVGNPVVIRKDTVEYAAALFKTSDSDMLEQLLKKLPGLEVSPDGSIKANGEPVKKITIGGKTFFLDDPKLASRNIPANLIEKVQVVEKRSDQSIFTGIDDGERETVIDLKFKPGMEKGWMGNVTGAGGHDVPAKGSGADFKDGWRWNASALAGHFDEKTQISLILNGNNINTTAFDDMSGSMMESMRGSLKGMGRGHAGWGGGNGITTSWMGGLNGVFTLCDGDMDLGANYLYSGADKQVMERADKITYLSEGNRLFNHDEGASSSLSQGHRVGMRLEHKFSENTSILFEPQFDAGTGRFSEYSRFDLQRAVGEGDPFEVNRGYRSADGQNRNWKTDGRLLFRQRLGKPGRTLSVNFKYTVSGNELAGLNQSLTSVADGTETAAEPGWQEQPATNQRYDSMQDKLRFNTRVSYTEPLGKGFFLEASYRFSWSRNTSSKKTWNSGSYDMDPAGNLIYDRNGEMLDAVYSNDVMQRYINQSAGLNLSWKKDKVHLQAGFSADPTDTRYRTNDKSYDKKVVDWAPHLSFRYDMGKGNSLKLNYYGYSEQPSVSQIMPVPDNSDPLDLRFGNPYLQSWFGHHFRGKFSFTDMKTFTSVYLRFGASCLQNPITNASWYDADGVRSSLPVNGRSNGEVYGGGMLTTPLGKSGFSLTNWLNLSYSNGSSYLGNAKMEAVSDSFFVDENGNRTDEFNYEAFHERVPDIEASGLFDLNRTDMVNFIDRFRLTYRCDLVELNLGARTMMTKSWYTLNKQQRPRWNNQVDFSMNWTIPAGFGLISDLDYNWYDGYVGGPKPEFVWNLEVSKLLFKKHATLALKAYDLLGQSKNLHVTDSSNYHQEVWNNTLGRYILISFTYRFGKGNVADKRGGGRHHPHSLRH